jgi:hypothetical protein
MKRDFDELFALFPGPGSQETTWLWNPLHPRALFCLLCAIAAMVVVSMMRGG